MKNESETGKNIIIDVYFINIANSFSFNRSGIIDPAYAVECAKNIDATLSIFCWFAKCIKWHLDLVL